MTGTRTASAIARVNAKGYGLTMGLHSRIARAAEPMLPGCWVCTNTMRMPVAGETFFRRGMIGSDMNELGAVA